MIKIDMEELDNTEDTNINDTYLLETIKNINKKEIINFENQHFKAIDSLF